MQVIINHIKQFSAPHTVLLLTFIDGFIASRYGSLIIFLILEVNKFQDRLKIYKKISKQHMFCSHGIVNITDIHNNKLENNVRISFFKVSVIPRCLFSKLILF